jgi:hypothetical protein
MTNATCWCLIGIVEGGVIAYGVSLALFALFVEGRCSPRTEGGLKIVLLIPIWAGLAVFIVVMVLVGSVSQTLIVSTWLVNWLVRHLRQPLVVGSL